MFLIPQLNPLLFLWDYFSSRVYLGRYLGRNIELCYILVKLMTNTRKQLAQSVDDWGRHLTDLIFKT